jgi:hypothetical protein
MYGLCPLDISVVISASNFKILEIKTSLFTFTGSFTVPTSVSNGLTRMRVVVNEGAVTGPTMLVSYGEFEEYSILLSGSGAGITAVS